MTPGDYDDDERLIGEDPYMPGTGGAHYVSDDKRNATTVQRLRDVVAEVTRGRIPAPVRRGPGF